VRISLCLFFFLIAMQPAFAKKDSAKKAEKNTVDTVTVDTVVVKKEKKEKTAKVVVKDTVEKDETKIKVSGVLEAGFDINNKVNKDETERKKIGYGQVELSATPVKKVKAEIAFEYKNRDSSSAVTIDKLYGQYNTDYGRVRVGYMKKSFGLEERTGVEERYFHKRSLINDGIEELGFLDHDLTFQYRYNFFKTWFVTGAFSWSGADSLRYLQNYAIQYDMSDSTTFILAAIIRHSTNPEYKSNTVVSSLSFRRAASMYVSEAELTYGTNPRRKLSENEHANLFGARIQEQIPININSKILRQLIPVAEAAIFYEDFDSKDFEAQLRAGLTFGFAKNSAFQWRNTYGTVLRMENEERELRRRRFDSEVVVIF
jgi:hypothetical protein